MSHQPTPEDNMSMAIYNTEELARHKEQRQVPRLGPDGTVVGTMGDVVRRDRWRQRVIEVTYGDLVIEAENEMYDDPDDCEGHESLNGADMGVTVYCDGTCR